MRPPTAEDYQISLSVDRVRVPELLLQPSLAGIDQAGLAELVMACLKRLQPHVAEACAQGGLLLTGGNAMYPGRCGSTCGACASASTLVCGATYRHVNKQ